MKRIIVLATIQIVMGCVIAVGCLFFDFSNFRKQELAVGKNLKDYSVLLESNKKLLDVTGENLGKISETLSAIAKKCNNISKTAKGIPFANKVSPQLDSLHDSLVKQAEVIGDTKNVIPQTMQTIEVTRLNLNNVGDLLINDSPVNKISFHIKLLCLMISAMMIINGVCFIQLGYKK